MALVDLLPVLFFCLGARELAADLKRKTDRPAKIFFIAGTWIVCVAGLLKALYKMIYALGMGNPVWMSEQFFHNQSFGFLLAGIGLTLAVTGFDKKRNKGAKDSGNDSDKENKAYSFALLPTMALVGLMVVGLAALDASLCYLAAKMKKRSAMVLFIANFFLSLGMGYLSSKNFDKASLNWIAQGINVAGQLAFFMGCHILHRAGLEKL